MPAANWPKPKPQPMSAARRTGCACATAPSSNGTSAAKPRSSAGKRSNGAKPRDENAPAMTAASSARPPDNPGLELLDVGSVFVVLVSDVADDLLDHVFDGDETVRAAVHAAA